MRPPRFRSTVSRLMVAVGIMAVAFGLAMRSREFRRIADRHDLVACAGPGSTPEEVRRLERRNVYNAAMARKYRLAAWLPFLPVWPDPPPPE
jgi:hypothetical protein